MIVQHAQDHFPSGSLPLFSKDWAADQWAYPMHPMWREDCETATSWNNYMNPHLQLTDAVTDCV